MRLYILRHGETMWNVQRRLQGQTDIELNEKGIALAKVTGEALKEIQFDLVISSPLCRAKETARLVLQEREIPMVEDDRIREISFGILEGLQVKNEAGEIISPDLYNFFHHPEKYEPKQDGENMDELCARTAEFLQELKQKQEWKDKTILISTHGAASRALLTAIKQTPRADFWEKGVPKNCAVTIVDLEHDKWIIKEQDVVYYEDI